LDDKDLKLFVRFLSYFTEQDIDKWADQFSNPDYVWSTKDRRRLNKILYNIWEKLGNTTE
jgi:hypothetical protein